MSTALRFAEENACAECGRFGAYAFDGVEVCIECYQQRGSCCAETANAAIDRCEERCRHSARQDLSDRSAISSLQTPNVAGAAVCADGEIHKLNPNCCYEACPRCSSVRRLREFMSRHPQDWRLRLRGSERLVRVAQQRD
jgi:hypothetical protein